MREARKLTLKREHLVELSGDELRAVAGGALSGVTCPVAYCADNLSDQLAACDSLLRPCITWGIGCATSEPC